MSHARRAFVALTLATSTVLAVPTTNPAEPEREVFTLLRNPDELVTKLDDLNTTPLDATVAAYIEQRRPALALLKQAASLPTADWGEAPDMQHQLDDLRDARVAVQLTWLAARVDAANGRPEQAVEELMSGIAVARHIGQRKLLVCHLVECGCESGAIDRLAKLLPTLPKAVVAALPAKLDALPPSSGLAGTIDGERAFGQKAIAQQMNAIPPVPAKDENAPPPDPTPRGQAEAAAKRAEDAKAAAAGQVAVTAQVNAMAPFYEAAKKASGQSPDAFEKSIKAAAAAMPGNTFVQILAPSLGRARVSSAVVEAKRAMLRTAIAITLSGDGELVKSKDPFGEGAFKRETQPGGYDLSGKLTNRGKPVTLHVGE